MWFDIRADSHAMQDLSALVDVLLIDLLLLGTRNLKQKKKEERVLVGEASKEEREWKKEKQDYYKTSYIENYYWIRGIEVKGKQGRKNYSMKGK